MRAGQKTGIALELDFFPLSLTNSVTLNHLTPLNLSVHLLKVKVLVTSCLYSP